MKRLRTGLLIILTCFASIAWPQAGPRGTKDKIITFDVPGAGTAAGQGTFAYNIVEGDWVAGDYVDSHWVYHGFLRAPDGKITKFDVPGMGTSAGQGTIEIFGLTPSLEIVGSYADENNAYHGFKRDFFGRVSTINCPGAGPGGTAAESVNPAGMISAMFLDVNGAWHGCIVYPDGTFVDYDPPDAGIASAQGTYATPLTAGINTEGEIVGEYLDSNYVFHGYLRRPNGEITEYSNPGASSAIPGDWQGTQALGIDPAGEIWGEYYGADYVYHGYLRSRDGSFTEIDVPSAGTGTFQGTDACWPITCFGGMNPAGTVTQSYLDNKYTYHGFLRTRDGEIIKFDAPNAGTGAWQGTQPASINPEGTITGYYTDANNVVHGFVRRADDEKGGLQ